MKILGVYVTVSRHDPAHVAFLNGMDLQRRLDSYELGQAYGRGYDDAKRGRPRQVQRWRLMEPVRDAGPAE